MINYGVATGTLSKNSDIVSISSEGTDVFFGPCNRGALILDSEISCTATICARFHLAARQEPENI